MSAPTRRAAIGLAIAAVLAPSAAHADDGRALTLDEAIAIARHGNDVHAAQAAAAERAARLARGSDGIDDLVIEAGAEVITRRTEPVDGPFFQETAVDAIGGRAAVWQPLPIGGRVGLELRDERVATDARLAAGAMTTPLAYTVHAPRVELVWQQPLLRGRGRAAHDLPRRLARAGAAVEAALLDASADQLAVDVATAYWELAYAARDVAIRAGALALAQRQLAITRARTDVGRGSGLEVQAVEQAIAAREAALLAAEHLRTERALELRVLLALDDGDARPLVAADVLVPAGDPPIAPVPAPDATEALPRALASSPALRALDHQLRAADARREAAERDLGARLDLVVRGGPAGQADTAADAWAQVARFDGYQATASLSFSLAVGDRLARGAREAAVLDRRRAAHERAAARGRLTAAVQRAVDAVALSDRRIAAAALAATLARANVDLEAARWQTGAGTNFDVLDRQDRAAAADAALARAHADTRIARAVLAALVH